MANNDFINLLSKMAGAILSAPKNSQKSANKPENATKSNQTKPSVGGDFSTMGQNYVSPKQSVMEMLRRHEELSKRIDETQK